MTFPYKRIMIFGRPGSGKSTFAHALHQVTDLPLYHLDKYFFSYNWIERDYDEFLMIQYRLIEQNEWIIDGNATKSLQLRWMQADVVIYFNYPRWLCYWRVLKRYITRNLFSGDKDIFVDDRAPHCKEKIQWKLLKYMYSFDERVRTTVQLMQEVNPKTPFYEVHNDTELKKITTLLGLKKI